MPNTGRPSDACHLCRSRRVKCDLNHPSCRRCIKYGVACPGYRDKFRAVDPTRPKRCWSRTSTAMTAAQGHDAGASPPMLRPLFEHWTVRSLPILLDACSAAGFVHELCRLDQADGPLAWTAHLFARTYVTNVSNPTAVDGSSLASSRRDMAVCLGRVLGAVRSALQTPEGASRDDILATVCVLAGYELLVGGSSRGGQAETPSPWHHHARGLYGILTTRQAQGGRSPAGRAIFWSALNLVVEASINETECPPNCGEWLSSIATDHLADERLALAVARFAVETTRVQSRMLCALRADDADAVMAGSIELMTDLIEAEDRTRPLIPSRELIKTEVDRYWVSFFHASLVKAHHVAHLFLNYLSHEPSCPIPARELEVRRDRSLQTVRASADQILEMSAISLHPVLDNGSRRPRDVFDAVRTMWPLTTVYAMPSTRPDQKTAAEQALLFIGRHLGVRQALGVFAGLTAAVVPRRAQVPLGFGESENVEWVGWLR